MSLTIQPSRESIIAMEESLKKIPGAIIGDSDMLPVKHLFADGMYIREIFIPAGFYVTGKIHNHSHPIFLMSGTLYLITEFDQTVINGPLHFISPPGAKRAAYAATDIVWVTVHLNPENTQDLQKLEDFIISKDFESFDLLQENNFIN